jgi:hypothetical protein
VWPASFDISTVRLWVGEANKLTAEMKKKPWRYALIPNDAVMESATLAGLVNKYG